MKKTLFLLLFFCSISVFLQGQSFQIMRYGINEGLCHESTYFLNQDANGYIWVSTTQGLCRLDGKSFMTSFSGDPLPVSVSSVSFKDSRNRIWFGYADGEVAMLQENNFKVFRQAETIASAIVGFGEDREGNILVMTQQQGLYIIDRNFKFDHLPEPFSGLFVSDFIVTDDNNLLVGGFNGLMLFSTPGGPESYREVGRIEGVPMTRVRDITKGLTPGSYWVGTEDEGFFRVSGIGNNPERYSVINEGVLHGMGYNSIYSIMTDDAGFLWVSDYGVGVSRFTIADGGSLSAQTNITVAGGLPEQYIKDILKDDEGNIWFASQSKGIAILRDQAFTFYNISDETDVPEVTALSVSGGQHWCGTRDGEIFLMDEGTMEAELVFAGADGLPAEAITALWPDEKNNLFIGTKTSGVFFLNRANRSISRFFYAGNSLGNIVNAVEGNENYIWVATNDGLYRIDRKDRSIKHQNTLTGLPHNVVNDVLIDREGLVWIATRGSGIYNVNDQGVNRSIILEGSPNLEFLCLAEDSNGRLWGGTYEDGVFYFSEDSLSVYSREDGLLSKYTYAVDVDPKGYVWVGHRLGLSRIDHSTGNVVVFDHTMGFTSDIQHRAIDVDKNGVVFFGTNNGLIAFDTYKERPDTIPPRLNITELNISDSIYDASGDILLPYGVYKMRIDFIGINLSNPDQVTYRYKLDGFDDWSEPTRETFTRYSRIEDGNYTFMVSACDGSGNCTGEVALLRISVKLPIWKRWWFIVSIAVIAITSVFMIIKIRERNQKALQEYLEQQLDERTREVLSQKEEIEIKNRDITDSINYAQRIQASILPSVQLLKQNFNGSFVFYQPRDIVSGDFYWYDRLDDERFMIICADSTGHGVPGAFMSMIGTTLIKDICVRPGVNTPSDVLRTLDEEVRTALHQNRDSDGSNDGMDIIVAEVNLNTNKFVVSSAMRPVIIYRNGEQIYVKGSRSSVGGQLDDASMEKEFINEEFQLDKGDIVYMFSDGYPDQFGGPLGRKFKMVRLKNLLRDIHTKPMDEQYNYIKSNFFLWKEDLEQVDDVLFMGIKL
ncbi:MAG: SpoIIE family protein phosphatase [Bacteroidales bacterium]|nr:SpoIIE family protein phosphatase [Bacteroidales bacterium]